MTNKDIRVMFICDYASVYAGNFIPSLFSIEQKLNGNAIYVFPIEAKKRNWVKNIENIEYIRFDENKASVIESIKELISKYRPTIVHTHFYKINSIKELALKFKDIGFIFHIHSDFSAGKNNIKEKIKNIIRFKLVPNNMIFISVAESFVKLNRRKIIYVSNALADRITSTQQSIEDFKEKLNISNKKVIFEIFGWSPYVKGVDIAVEAINRANKINNKYVLFIICGEKTDKEFMKKYINNNTSCNGDEDFIVYLEPIEDVFIYHKTADVLLSASRSEGFSYSILEMLSIGKRCLISDINGTKWAAKYHQTAIFGNEDIENCKDAILNIDKLASFSQETIDNIKSDYSIAAWAERIVKIYENLNN